THPQPARVAPGAHHVPGGGGELVGQDRLPPDVHAVAFGGQAVAAGAGVEGIDGVVGRSEQQTVAAGLKVGAPGGVGHVGGGFVGADMDAVVVDVVADAAGVA